MRALGVALMVMAGTVQGAETHRMWVERGWSARDAGRSRECARAFAEATHAAVKEQADQEAIDRFPIRETRNYVARVMSALWRRTHNAERACETWLHLMNGVWPRLNFSPIRGRSRESVKDSGQEAVAPRRLVRR